MPRGIPNNPQAKHAPALPNAGLETAEQEIGHTVREGEGVGKPLLVTVAEPFDDEKEAMLRFMEEPVTIRPTRTTDKTELVFEIIVNGRGELFRVGQEKTVKRYFVDHMARMKVTNYTQQEITNAEGIKQFINVPHTTLKYDFAMVRDANPLGESWLKATLAQGG